MKKCRVCGQQIPEGRLKAVPGTDVCTQHSNTSAYVANIVGVGNPDDDHYEVLDIVRDARTAEQLQQYKQQAGIYRS